MNARARFHARFVFDILLIAALAASFAASCTGPGIPTWPSSSPSAAPQPSAAITATGLPTPTALAQPGQHPVTMQVQVRLGEKSSQDFTVSYLIYLPESYPVNTARRWPLILFLHGSGEAGKNLGLLTRTGLPQKLESEPDFPFVVVSPQITAPPVQGEASASFDVQVYLETWGWKRHIDILEALLDYMQATYRIDPQRVFLTGISLGGFGAWEYALRHPDRFAAVVPIAGGFRYVDDELPTNLCDLKEVPIWTFHGELDTNVPLRCSQAAVYGLKACGTEVRFTQYPDLAHNVWTTAYNTPELWEWLLAQKKN